MKTKIIFLLLLIGCNSREKKQVQLADKNNQMNIENVKYYINYDLFMSYEVYINDVKIINEHNSGPASGYEDLNSFLRQGENIIRLKSYVFGDESLYDIEEDLIKSMKLEIWTSDVNDDNIKKLKSFVMPDIKTPKPFVIDLEWTFEVEIPYSLEVWSNTKDLTKLDKEELEKKVVTKFNEYRNMLNFGNASMFMKEQEKSNLEVFKSLYYSNETIRQELGTSFFELQKNIMMSLENYEMKFYGNGRLVTLERKDIKTIIANTKKINIFGKSALLAYRDEPLEEDGISFYYDYVLLMMKNGSNELEIARVIQSID